PTSAISARMAADAHKTIAFWTGTIHFASNASLRLKAMGLGPPILALYRQLKLLGALDGIDSVVELGSQGVWCPDRRLLTGLFDAFSRPVPPNQELEVYINNTATGHAA